MKCSRCRQHPPEPPYRLCSRCRADSQQHYAETSLDRKAKRVEAAAQGLCTQCFVRPRTLAHNTCEKCTANRKRYESKLKVDTTVAQRQRMSDSQWSRERRRRVIEHYGGVCVCCGESHYEFLSLDHVNGDGAEHRRQVANIVTWALKNGFPPSLQVLCYNCNCSRGFWGYCPHEEASGRALPEPRINGALIH